MSCSIESLLISFVFRAAFRLPVFFLCKADLSERFPVPDFTIDSSKTKSFPGFISSVRFFSGIRAEIRNFYQMPSSGIISSQSGPEAFCPGKPEETEEII
jgi:hypothetical protein